MYRKIANNNRNKSHKKSLYNFIFYSRSSAAQSLQKLARK